MAKYIALAFADNDGEEEKIAEAGLSFTSMEVSMNQIDERASIENHARSGPPVIPHVVDDYYQKMKDGRTFPKIILGRLQSGLYKILDGNQRYTAMNRLIADEKIPKNFKFSAYVIEVNDPLKWDYLMTSANRDHGWGESPEFGVERARHLHVDQGLPLDEAARSARVSVSAVKARIDAEQVRKTLLKCGVAKAAEFKPSVLRAFKRLERNTHVLTTAAQLAADRKLKTEDVSDLCKRVAACKSERDQMEGVKEWEKIRFAPKPAPSADQKIEPRYIEKPRRSKLVRLLTGLHTFLDTGNNGKPFDSLDQLQVFGDDRDTVASIWKRVRSSMNRVIQ